MRTSVSDAGLWQILGIDILTGCKGAPRRLAPAFVWADWLSAFGLNPFSADPAKQFALVAQHIQMLRQHPGRAASRVMIYVERNLGFEAGPCYLGFLSARVGARWA